MEYALLLFTILLGGLCAIFTKTVNKNASFHEALKTNACMFAVAFLTVLLTGVFALEEMFCVPWWLAIVYAVSMVLAQVCLMKAVEIGPVSPYKTSFVPEFEFAAQYAISKGAGTFVVAPSTYGWHIIYVTYAYDAGDVYAGFDVNAIEDEGTFSYFYYEAMREARSSEFANVVQTDVLEQYNKEECVTLYKDAYKDLLELDS